MKKHLILAISAAFVCVTMQAKVSLPSFFSDNMVLQHSTDVAVWGTTDKGGAKITVCPSWDKKKYTVTASVDGKWSTRIPTPAPGGPYSISFSDGDKTVIDNVLIGEVWLCGGQSNMEMPMKGFNGQPVEDATRYILTAKPSKPVRMCTIKLKASTKELDTTEGSWGENTPEVVFGTSATAWFFGQMLQDVLDVPVGLLVCCWGGSPVETWMRRDILESNFAGEFDLTFLDQDKLPKRKPHHYPCTAFNGMLSALIPFTFKGMIWYQGEANRLRPEQYTRLQPTFVNMIRDFFENPEAPFYFVQIAPYKYENGEGFESGYFYEAQEKTLALIPGSGMISTVDIGEYATIHPRKKKEVGDRLALQALSKTYGINLVEADSPSFNSVAFEDGKAVVTMNVGPLGLSPINIDLPGFELAGEDHVFYPATGIIKDKVKVIVSSPDVPAPVAVRYCFRNFSVGTLFNCSGLPARPFRSDNW